MIKKTFKIPDMSCTNCAMKIESLEDDLDGVKDVYKRQIHIPCQHFGNLRLRRLLRKVQAGS